MNEKLFLKRNSQIANQPKNGFKKSSIFTFRTKTKVAPLHFLSWIVISVILLGVSGFFCLYRSAYALLMPILVISNIFCVYKLYKHLRYLEDRQRQINDQLVQSNKLSALGEIVTGIAHEINNPLAIIYQEVQWIQHCLSSDDPESLNEIRDSVQEVSRQVQRCRDITHKLLEFARKRKPVTQPANLNEIIEEMVKLVECTAIKPSRVYDETELGSTVSEGVIRIERYYEDSLPLIAIDVPLIKQVILNLLINAVQALDKKGGIVTVSTKYNGGDYVEFSVSDTGCGIPPEHLEKIFLPFFTTKPPGQGTGLGLSLSYTIVHSMGGMIDVESTPGKGSRFTVKLPIDAKNKGMQA